MTMPFNTPAHQKPPRWTFDLFYQADIFTRHGHEGDFQIRLTAE